MKCFLLGGGGGDKGGRNAITQNTCSANLLSDRHFRLSVHIQQFITAGPNKVRTYHSSHVAGSCRVRMTISAPCLGGHMYSALTITVSVSFRGPISSCRPSFNTTMRDPTRSPVVSTSNRRIVGKTSSC